MGQKTLEAQYETVVKLTNKSHPMAYGDQTFKKSDLVHMYQAHGDNRTVSKTVKSVKTEEHPKIPVDQRDIELLQVFYQYLRSDENEDGTKLPPAELAGVAARRSSLASELT